MFSLRMLLVVVTLSAVYTAGMVYHTEWWEASILTLTYLIFALSIAASILSREHRAFFVTFAAFGLAYGLAVYLRMELVTTRALDELASRVHDQAAPRNDAQPGSPLEGLYENPFEDAPRQPGPPGGLYASIMRLKSIGQASFAVLFGLVTGVIAEAVVGRRLQASSSTVRASGPLSVAQSPS